MSSLNRESENQPKSSLPRHQNAPLDSGLGSSINPPSGSFGEGYQQLSGSYEYESEYIDEYDQAGPLSLPPASLPLLTTVIDNSSQQVSGNGDNSDSSTVAHSTETGLASTVTVTGAGTINAHTGINSDPDSLVKCTTAVNAACTDLKGYSLLNSSDGCTTNASTVQTNLDLRSDSNSLTVESHPPDPNNSVHDGAISATHNEVESDTDQDQNDSPSPVLSHVRAEPLKLKEVIIRESVVERHPEVISERVLIESTRSPSPP